MSIMKSCEHLGFKYEPHMHAQRFKSPDLNYTKFTFLKSSLSFILFRSLVTFYPFIEVKV